MAQGRYNHETVLVKEDLEYDRNSDEIVLMKGNIGLQWAVM